MKEFGFLAIIFAAAVAPLVVLATDTFSRRHFPPDFAFGASTSAYQVEGAANEDGRKPRIWDTFAHAGYMGGADGNIACDEYHKYKAWEVYPEGKKKGAYKEGKRSNRLISEELHLTRYETLWKMCNSWLKWKAYRFSISWSRVIPDGKGAVNPKGVLYYNNLVLVWELRWENGFYRFRGILGISRWFYGFQNDFYGFQDGFYRFRDGFISVYVHRWEEWLPKQAPYQ